MKLYKRLMAKYGPGLNQNNGLYLYGMAKAYDTVQLISKLGKNPTRAGLMKAARKMNWTNPFALQGVKVKTGGSDQFPISQIQLIQYNNGLWNPQGELFDGRSAPSSRSGLARRGREDRPLSPSCRRGTAGTAPSSCSIVVERAGWSGSYGM